ncbi:hypothetical protein SKAU_G00430140 [Synaphobranchus kaupii]|uniref:Uncharacterized protein n=1 Tax=Synaphobranchus kaupii TaxID=118154 RepID=A0A9Q1E496_SYNKA|nr:hypothetical protein SKAU_G00430140 [Synaphobranchus kaupii]
MLSHNGVQFKSPGLQRARQDQLDPVTSDPLTLQVLAAIVLWHVSRTVVVMSQVSVSVPRAPRCASCRLLKVALCEVGVPLAAGAETGTSCSVVMRGRGSGISRVYTNTANEREEKGAERLAAGRVALISVHSALPGGV